MKLMEEQMKKICFILLMLTFSCVLFAKENLVIIGFQALDGNSRNITNMLERRDLGALFNSSDHFNLIMGREVNNAMRALNISSTMERLSSDEANLIGEQLEASIVIWGTVVGINNTEFRMSGTMRAMRTGNVSSFSFIVERDRTQRENALRTELYPRLTEFAHSEMTRIYDMALQHYHNRNFESAEPMFLRVIGIDEGNIDAYYYLGIMQFEQNRFPQAVEYYNRGLQIDPDNEVLLLSIANAYRRQGLRNQAIDALYKVADIRSDKNIYYNIALLYNESGMLEQTQATLDKALELDPDFEEAHSLYAEITYDSRDYEKAITHLLFMSELRPDDEETARRLALSYQRTGQLDRAIDRYLGIIEVDSSNITAIINLANAYRAIAIDSPNEAARFNREALQAFLSALRLNPNNARVEMSVSDTYLALNDLVNAERYANQALQKQDDIYEASLILGTIAQRRGIERYNEFVELQTITDSGELFGSNLDETIVRRNRTRAEAHTLFNNADAFFKAAMEKTNVDRIKSDINTRIQGNQQYINLTRPDFFNE